MDQALSELNEILNGQSPTSIGGIPCQAANHSYLATEEVNSLGPNPSLSQTTALIMTQCKKTEEEMSNSNRALAHHLIETLATVKQMGEDLIFVKQDLSAKTELVSRLEGNQQRMAENMTRMEQRLKKIMLCALT